MVASVCRFIASKFLVVNSQIYVQNIKFDTKCEARPSQAGLPSTLTTEMKKQSQTKFETLLQKCKIVRIFATMLH
jgi:hypothetical protein